MLRLAGRATTGEAPPSYFGTAVTVGFILKPWASPQELPRNSRPQFTKDQPLPVAVRVAALASSGKPIK